MEQDSDYNHFDDLVDVSSGDDEAAKAVQAKMDKERYLVHQVFKQNEKGAELLEIWKKELMMRPTVIPGADQFSAGINEGGKTMIRNIITTIESVEND